MAVRVLGISSSPRKNGNSDLLIQEALRGAKEAGGEIEYVRVEGMKISPCYSCGYCEKHGVCRQDDDFPALLEKMLKADLLIFATPIYFMSVCAWGKMVIDRCQCLWARKYKLNQQTRDKNHDWAGMSIAVGATKSVKMFDSIRLTMKYFYDVLEINQTAEVFVNKVDEKGAIKEHPEFMEESYKKAGELVKKLSRC